MTANIAPTLKTPIDMTSAHQAPHRLGFPPRCNSLWKAESRVVHGSHRAARPVPLATHQIALNTAPSPIWFRRISSAAAAASAGHDERRTGAAAAGNTAIFSAGFHDHRWNHPARFFPDWIRACLHTNVNVIRATGMCRRRRCLSPSTEFKRRHRRPGASATRARRCFATSRHWSSRLPLGYWLCFSRGRALRPLGRPQPGADHDWHRLPGLAAAQLRHLRADDVRIAK